MLFYSLFWLLQFRYASNWDRVLIAVGLLASIVAGMTLPYAITLVANVFQGMITYTKSAQAGTQDDQGFLTSMHGFGVHYSCVGLTLFMGGYLGTALMKMTALNQVCASFYLYILGILTLVIHFHESI